MGLTGKVILPLFGALMLCGLVIGAYSGYDDVNSLPPEEKRRIIRELIRAQKDIRRALLKVHYSLNGEESEGYDDDDDEFRHGCWDKELAGFRANLEEKMASLSSGLKLSNEMMDEIAERIKPGHHGNYESGYGGGPEYGGGPAYGGGPEYGYGPGYGGDYGNPGYGPGYGPKPRPPRPTKPPLTTTPETTSWRPTTTESYGTGDNDDDSSEYYARKRGANRRYGRDLNVDAAVEEQEVKHEPGVAVDDAEQPGIDSDVAEALDTLFEDKE
ncbi:uncharacterized protein LOC131294376 [Anopheles ziemanni]|uniref:uncharacterized protein LOC131265043 n=1 Tax=Anopheles coustani TaxID=139045 RepID=UPI002657EFA8|nr:uncharacterized protein LOC131265043 [Anopheles coustani]XP_058178408.1 uncharacterized protein LOC131294376 [Anopheles ziemanni]